MPEPAISARNISVTFTRRGTFSRLRRTTSEPDEVHALRDVSFEVRHGEAFGIIGPNGAGKSTLMRVIGQTLVPDGGDLTVRGATSTLLQLGVGFNPQLDGSRNIVLGLLAAGLSLTEIDELHDQIWEYSELGDALHRPLSTYSRGMQSRLAFAIATYVDAEILLVDEVLAVGDESFKQKSLATMRGLLEDAGTIVMVSHALGTVQEFCDRVMWLEEGAVQQIGDPATVVGAYRDKHTLGDVRLVRATRSDADHDARPLDVRRPEAMDTDLLRKNRSGKDAPMHIDLAPPTPMRAAPRRARKLLDRGWRLAKGDMVSLVPPIDWPTGAAADNQPELMAWDPVATLLMAHTTIPDHRWVQAASAIAVDWSRTFPTIDDSPVWTARTTAIRAHRLAALVDHASRDALMSDTDLSELTVLAQQHAWILTADDHFASGESAGLQQITAALSLADRVPELPDADQLEHVARQRLHRFIEEGQAKDGAWLTHTPSLDAAFTEQLTHLIENGLAADKAVMKARNKSERALSWFVMPDGSIPGFGEAVPFQASDWLAGADKPSLAKIKRRWHTGAMRAAASASKAGSAPEETTMTFPTGGYVVLRDRWPDDPQTDASYVAMMAGRHSSSQKHADDLSVVWFDRGRHLLVDSGTYQDDSDPHRSYVTSARAHNAVEIDGADQYPGSPFGSGATHSGTLGTMRYGAGRALFGNDLITRRIVVLEPGAWLLVVDLLRDRAKVPHTYRQWFHPDASLEATQAGAGFRLRNAGIDVHAVSLSGATAVPAVRGAVDPRQGWISPTSDVIEPAWAIGWETGPAHIAGFASLLSLNGPPTEIETILNGAHRASTAFRIGDDLVNLEIDLREDAPLHRT